jgi:hypothetical protein
MDDTTILWKIIGAGVLGLIGLVAYFAREDRKDIKDTLKEHAVRLDRFDKCVVTRDEFERTLSRIQEGNHEKHLENRSLLERIENKIDANEERASKTRHDTKDEVHSLSMRLAMLSRTGRSTDER